MPDYRRFFDPNAYRIVLVDQRGSGQKHSMRTGGQHYLAPRGRHRAVALELGIERWLVFGGSWEALGTRLC